MTRLVIHCLLDLIRLSKHLSCLCDSNFGCGIHVSIQVFTYPNPLSLIMKLLLPFFPYLQIIRSIK